MKNEYFTKSNNLNWMCDIDDYYLQSSVSIYGLREQVKNFRHAVMAVRGEDYDISKLDANTQSSLVESCRILYALLHARFIMTEEGAEKMMKRYEKGVFGVCPRYSCRGQRLLPYGKSRVYGEFPVMCYCPRCHDIYKSDAPYDGACFGPNAPFMAELMGLVRNVHPFKRIDLPCPEVMEKRVEREEEIEERRLVRWIEYNPQK